MFKWGDITHTSYISTHAILMTNTTTTTIIFYVHPLYQLTLCYYILTLASLDIRTIMNKMIQNVLFQHFASNFNAKNTRKIDTSNKIREKWGLLNKNNR